jgi:mRNA interferase RelE/StbE
MRELSDDPRSASAEKLRGHDLFRIRQGDYRVVYEIDDHDRTVTVFKVGHRREVYR